MNTLTSYEEQALSLIKDERVRQEYLRVERQWGRLEDEDYHVLNTVLGEETGEVARAVLELGRAPFATIQSKKCLEALRDEAVQVAAVAAQIAEKAIHELSYYA